MATRRDLQKPSAGSIDSAQREINSGQRETNTQQRTTNTEQRRRNTSQRITNLDIYARVLEVKEDVVLLREHVNHRSGIIEATILRLEGRIDGKAEKTDLLTSIGFKLLSKSFIRWSLGAAGATMLATISREHWVPRIEEFLRFVF